MVNINLSGGGAANQTLKIDSFRGLDYSTAPYNISSGRSPDALNVEPLLNGAVGCRHGYEDVLQCEGRINGIYSLTELKGTKTLIHHGNKLSLWDTDSGSLTAISVVFPDCKSSCAQMGNKLYIFSGETAYVYGEYDVFDELGNKTGTQYEVRKMEDEAYIPTVLISSTPIKTTYKGSSAPSAIIGEPVDSDGGGGSKYEDFNLISAKSRVDFLVSAASAAETLPTLKNNTYTGKAGDYYYKLPLPQSPIQSVEKVEKLNSDGDWEEVLASTYTVDTDSGILTFNAPLSVTPVSGKDNYRVTYSVDWWGDTEERVLITKVESPRYSNYNFNPPIISKYSSADDYNKYLDGTYYSAYKYRILLGTDIANNGAVRIRLTGERTTISGVINKMFFDDKNDNRVKLDYIDLTAGYTAEEHKIPIPGTNDYVAGKLWDDASSCDAGWYVYLRIYTQVVKDGENYYLDITQPYGIFTDLNKHEDQVIAYFLGLQEFNKIKLTYSKKNSVYADRINKATIATKFGASGNVDRLFVAGWDKMREYEFWSEIDNPLYFPDLNYACLGDGDTAIMGWSRINNNQIAIHKNSNGSDPTIYVQSANVDNKGKATFPITEGPAGSGAISQRAFGVLCGEPLFLSDEGIFATKYVADVATDVRYAVPRSYYINPKLREFDLTDAEAIVFNNRYYLSLGNGYVLFADGKQEFMIGGNQKYDFSYEWYLWDNVPARVWWIFEGNLYFGTDDGRICRFNDGYSDNSEPINCYWTTPPLSFGTTPYYKKIKNVVVSCVLPTTEFSEFGIDYIDLKRVHNVKNYMIDNTSGKRGMVQSIPTNYKVKKVTSLQVRVRANNAENFVLQDISVLYTISGKFKG